MLFASRSTSIQNAGLSTHVLDISLGKPGQDIEVKTYHLENETWDLIGKNKTDSNGRISSALFLEGKESKFSNGLYKLRFEIGKYYEEKGILTFYPYVEIFFKIDDSSQHFHVPLTLSPFGYSTYKGQ
ncbi:unnamed protein product, partial [Mesorhabditis belari]|uniref:5-hydroxyisourate hydrolase n=1 Tax=Mesorhabditis belari TaxID=2138241 RepID=A0AAF3FCG4_9BILA